MSRRTSIVEEELLDEENFENEVFEILTIALKEEQRLLKRFYYFCDEYENFDYDESGINMDESKDLLRKSHKIKDLILSNIEENVACVFSSAEIETQSKIIKAILNIKNNLYVINIEIMNDSFNLELIEKKSSV